MKPARFVGGRYLVEAEPFDLTVMSHYRGVDPETLERVVVVEPDQHVEDYLTDGLFERAIAQLSALRPIAPRVLHVYGRDRRARAAVLEDLEGLSLEHMLAILR